MLCKLCNLNEANKDNTHYLTDAIIRSCLNLEGTNSRENGFYFDISNNTPFIDFSFQRNTSAAKLEQMMGRVPSDKEIEKAKKIPFSVDKVFCGDCEDIFTLIEKQFIEEILPMFREADLSQHSFVSVSNNKSLRLFFYLQLWRSDVCQSTLRLSSSTSEQLRKFILNHNKLELNEIKQFPLLITYLITEPKPQAYTTNVVGFTNDKNPKIILLNDFIVFFFEDPENVHFIELYNLYDQPDFLKHVNKNESDFIVRIKNNAERESFIMNYIESDKRKLLIKNCLLNFNNFWRAIFNSPPSSFIIDEYIGGIINQDKSIYLKYTRQEIIDYTANFIMEKVR